MTRKLVISYSDVDREAALKIRAQLDAAGHDVWIDREGIRGAVHWTQAILEAIDNCEGLVLVWSEGAKKSEDVREEIRLARVFRKPIFPVLAHPMSRIPGLPEEIGTLQVIGSGELAANIAELKARLDDPLKSNIQYAELVKNAFILKAHNPYFVGRVRELKALFVDTRGYRGGTKTGIPVSISGLPGIGKTHLALAFGYRFNLFFPDGVYWVDAQNGIVPEFGRIGHQLRVKTLRDEHPRDYAVRVRDKLCQLSSGLIIFDNITDSSEFRDWYPQGAQSCSVILTSRIPPRGIQAKTMNLTELDPESAYEMLIARRQDGEEIRANKVQRDALIEICRIIGNHPLALELCASSLESLIMPSDYLKFIQPDPLRRLGDENINEVPPGAGSPILWKIFRNSYSSLDEKLVDPYFLLMCCLAPHVIDQKLILQAYGKPDEGVKVLNQLVNLSFIRREQANMLSLHPLVAQFGRSSLKDKEFDYTSKFVEIVLNFLREHKATLASDVVRRQKPHIDEALRVAEANDMWDACVDLYEYKADIETGLKEQIKALEDAYHTIEKYVTDQRRRLPGLHLRLGKARRTAGQLNDALDDFNQAEVLYCEIKNVDPAETASLHFELGDTLLALGRYAEAEKTLSNGLEMALTYLDTSAPEVLQLRRALARRALYLGDFGTADVGFTDILGYRKKFYIAQPDATSAAGLASVHADLSRLALARAHYADAIQSANDALKITKEYHKESDPDCSHLYLLLGNIYYKWGDYSQAEEQLDKAHRNFLNTFGELHPNYARTLIALGEVHRKQGKFDKAETEVERAIAIFERVYGNSHPFVAEALEVQAKIYDHRCEFDKEKVVWQRILKIQHQFYSEQHPALATTHYDYASLFLRKGEYEKAAKHLQLSLQITEQTFGQTHADYFGRRVRLATCYYEQQEYSLAQGILNDAKILQPKIFGDKPHPFVARMLQLQSEILRRHGRFVDALKVIDQAIAMKKEIYGTEEHPSVAEALEEKIKIFHHLGERIKAKLLIERALEIRRKAYRTENHPEVSRSIHDLGSYYLRLGQYADAIKQFERARQITATVFGERHPDYVERTLNLANARNKQGEYKQALELVAQVERVLPSGNHYLTARWLQLMGELHRRIGQFHIAMDYIDQAIKMKKVIYGTDDHPSIAEALEVQAKIYDHLCEFDKEQPIWERILEIQHQFYPEQHPVLANTHYDYSSLFLRKGEYDKAAEHVQSSLQITEHNFGKIHADYFGSLVRLAICRYEQQEYSLAQDILDDAKKLQPKIFEDSPHPYIARMLQLQSEILRRQAKFGKALEVIEHAIAMKEEIYGIEGHPSVAEALEVKVDLMLSQLHVQESREILHTIERIRTKAYGQNHPDYANYQMRQAEWYEIAGEYDAAIEILKQSLQTCLNVFSIKHPETIKRKIMLARMFRIVNDIVGAETRINDVCDTLGTRLETEDSLIAAETFQEISYIKRVKGDYRVALAELEKALRIETKIFGFESPEVIELQKEKVKLLIIFRRLPEAHDLIKSALQHVKLEQPVFKQLKSDLLEQRGILLVHRKACNQAIEALEEAIKLKTDLLGDENVELARLYIEKAVVLRHLSKYNEALTSLELAHNIDNRHFDENHIFFARILLEQGQTYLDKTSFWEAQEYLKEALQIYDSQPNKNVKQRADAVEALGRNYLKNGLFREASESFQKAIDIRTAIYGSSHPEIAEALYSQATTLLRMPEARGVEGSKIKARQKLEQALNMLGERDGDNAELISNIECTLADL